jgi:sortase A
MIPTSGIIYSHDWHYQPQPHSKAAKAITVAKKRSSGGVGLLMGLGLLALSLGGMTGPNIPMIRLESQYRYSEAKALIDSQAPLALAWAQTSLNSWLATMQKKPAPAPVAVATPPKAVPAFFAPLTTPDGSSIDPADREFGIVVPKVGINAAVIPAVDPTKPDQYNDALLKGIAHSSLSYFPDEDGTVYLFSHSTNYDWFVKDLNAAFYLLKNLETGDRVVIFYKQKQYEYSITDKRIVSPTAVSYLVPEAGTKRLILQTCWPPGSTTERLLIFADIVEQPGSSI